MSGHNLNLTQDEALVLVEFFERFDATDKLEFLHPAELIAFQRISAQIDRATPAIFDPAYHSLLAAARLRISAGYEHDPNQSAFDGF